MCYTFHISVPTTAQQYFTSNYIQVPAQHKSFHIKPHFTYLATPPDHTWHDVDSVVLCLMWLWCGIRCDIDYAYGVCYVMSCNVRWGVVKCGDAMWNEWCATWWCAVAKCGSGIPSDVEWFDAILDMAVWCGITVEMQCGMCGTRVGMCAVG